tara:strand:+ start:966 stop:2102 length:1137 start_codon:yes stop_codon:yes gene_type:complete
MKKLLFYKFLFVLLFGCGEYDELENSETEYVNFNFILNENEINLSSNLNLSYFNDITIGVKENSDNYISLITAQSNQTIEISGTNLENLNNSNILITPPGDGDLPYANYIGVGQIIRSNNKMYGLYHGEWHDGTILPGGVPGFYASIGLVESNDGKNFSISSDPIIPNYIGKNQDNGAADGGYGEPSMLYSKDSTELYVYYVDHNRDDRGVNICMGKFDVINNEPDFSKFDFLNENNKFTSDLIKTKEVVKGEFGKSDATFPHVTYNKTLGIYIMVYNLNAFSNGNCNKTDSGIYITYSLDGINWVDPQKGVSYIGESKKLISECSIIFNSNNSFAWHPSLIYTNIEQTEGYLLYSFASNLQYPGHQLHGRKFNIEIF